MTINTTEMTYLVLVVDDDPIFLQQVSDLLTSQSMGVVTVKSGEEALQNIDSGQRFDLVLLDIMMPGMSGYEVCKQIRHHHSAVDLPVVMITAKSQPQDIVQGLNSGANDYLTKQFVKEELLTRVKTQLEIKKAHSALLENQLLKKEIRQRQQTEHDLRLTQHRLNALLDSVPDAVIAINENAEINFCNHAFEKLTGYRFENLLGLSPCKILINDSELQLELWLEQLSKNANLDSQNLQLKYSDNTLQQHLVLPHVLELEEEFLLMLVIQQPPALNETLKTPAALALIEMFNKYRIRLHKLEETLSSENWVDTESYPELSGILHDVDNTYEQLNLTLFSQGINFDVKNSMVEVMRLSINYWMECTQLSKADLARRSGLWKVYTNEDGWERTQTLDRYLSLETMPKHPRRKKVHQTARYVLSNCQHKNALRHEVENALAQLRSSKLS